jgi:uncharacterized membrane protein
VVEPNGMALEHLLIPYIDYLTFGIHIAVGIIIGISVIIALVGIFRILLLKNRNRNEILIEEQDKHGGLRHAILFENVRMRLARGLLLALDFEVGSDILKTVLDPSFAELAILSVIVGIRIALSWSLSKELSRQSEHLGREVS